MLGLVRAMLCGNASSDQQGLYVLRVWLKKNNYDKREILKIVSGPKFVSSLHGSGSSTANSRRSAEPGSSAPLNHT